MEGISHEVCSLAGALALGKLIAIYDDNHISIDGEVKGWFRDDTPRRFEAYGWHVIPEVDGHDVEAVDRAIRSAKAVTDKPSLVCCQTVIGKGSPKRAGTAKAHGEALGADEVAATRAAIGWGHPPFEVPQDVYKGWDARKKGAALEQTWKDRLAAYEKAHPALAREFRRRMAGELPESWGTRCHDLLEKVDGQSESSATRKASQNAIEGLAPILPELVGGSADLTGSNLTQWSGSKAVGREGGGNYLFYGVREFGMSAAMNGIALHGGLIPYGGTFLTFADYSRNALRMAALMKIRSIFVFTHDSIGLGEDGPTHQSVEHAAALRAIPGMDVWRPCDTVESAAAWIAAIERKDGPSSLLFTRQNVPFQKRDAHTITAIRRGGYILADAQDPKAVIVATGSEVQLAVAAKQRLAAEGVPIRVVSMPCTAVFDRQLPMYRDVVLIPTLPKVAVEAGVSDFWRKYVGLEGAVVGIDRYGESAPGPKLFEHFGFTADNVVKAVKSVLK
jgi:transketolase